MITSHCCLIRFTGYHGTVLCVVLLSAASSTAMEQNEAQMGKFSMHFFLDGGSNSLVVVGLYA